MPIRPNIFFAGDIGGMIALQPALKFNGGGFINHCIFWTNLSPQGGGVPQGKLKYQNLPEPLIPTEASFPPPHPQRILKNCLPAKRSNDVKEKVSVDHSL